MTDGMEQICQACGADVRMEVSWNHWGVEALYFECTECGRSGQCEPKPADLARQYNRPDGQSTLEEQDTTSNPGENGG